MTMLAEATAHGLSATASFATTVGQPASVRAPTRDTALRVGAGFRLRPRVFDLGGNPRADAVAVTTLSGGSSIQVVDGDSLLATTIGRVAVRSSAFGLADTMWISVVPTGTLAAYSIGPSTANDDQLAVFDTDGRDWRVLHTLLFHYNFEPAVDWEPDGNAVAFQDAVGGLARLFRANMTGTVTPLLSDANRQAEDQVPRYSRDGAWVYYTGVLTPWSSEASLFRASQVGGGVERLTLSPSIYTTDAEPDASPDGTRVVFVTDRPDFNPGGGNDFDLAILNLADSAITVLSLPARTPRWSPVGDQIAFISGGQVWLVSPDGSNLTQLTSGTETYRPGLSWAPDAQWLVAATESGIRVIEVQTGLTLPLAFTRYFVSPSWRP
ncbi:MAG TPA: hypothetical protein PKA66_13875 [Gemmatimonadales bacterium]|nr:hypothetical protein [Gemmatimonadales bacterium]